MSEDEVAGTLWRRHRHWSMAADRLKAPVFFWRTVILILSATGAALQTLSASVTDAIVTKPAAVVGAVALGAVPFITGAFLGAERVRKWLRARSVSEGLKSEVYRFRARAAPYDKEEDRVAKLSEAGRKLEVWVETLAIELASVEPDQKSMPGSLDPDSYLKRRVNDQIEFYYRVQARKNATGAERFRILALVTSAAAAVLGAVATALQLTSAPGSKGGIGAWVAVLTTVGGGLAAHAAMNRYEQQARMYFATARRLEDLRDDWIAKGRPADSNSWSAFVNACEEAISAENRGWMAKLDPEEKTSTS